MPSKSFGPLTRNEFFGLVDSPHGHAIEIIREHDPLWARTGPDPKSYIVKIYGYDDDKLGSIPWAVVNVEADNEKDAKMMALIEIGETGDWEEAEALLEEFDFVVEEIE